MLGLLKLLPLLCYAATADTMRTKQLEYEHEQNKKPTPRLPHPAPWIDAIASYAVTAKLLLLLLCVMLLLRLLIYCLCYCFFLTP